MELKTDATKLELILTLQIQYIYYTRTNYQQYQYFKISKPRLHAEVTLPRV